MHVTPDDLPAGFGYRSGHTLPFSGMLDLGRRFGLAMPREMSIHGLCVEDPWTFGQDFTPAVERTWREWAEQITRAEFGVVAQMA